VIAGLDDWNLHCIREFTGQMELPWVVARTEPELLNALDALVADADLRQQIGLASRRFMEDSWNERRVLRLLLEVYESL